MHLKSADVVTTVNQCEVRNAADWLGCMAQLPGVGDHSNMSDFDAASSQTANQLLEIMGQPAVQPGGSRFPCSPCYKGLWQQMLAESSYGSAFCRYWQRKVSPAPGSRPELNEAPICSLPHRHCESGFCGCTGGGYCISQDLQAHSKACKSSSECKVGELCFHEARQRGRKLADRRPTDQKPKVQTLANSTLSRRVAGYWGSRQWPMGSQEVEEELGSGRGLAAEPGTTGSCVKARSALRAGRAIGEATRTACAGPACTTWRGCGLG